MSDDQSRSAVHDDVMATDQSASSIVNDAVNIVQSAVDESMVTEQSEDLIEHSSQSNSVSVMTPPPSTSSPTSSYDKKLIEPTDQLDRMIQRLSVSDAHFKHQQRNEPDLSVSQKADIARTLFHEHPVKFLSQFSKYLKSEDLEYISHQYPDNSTVSCYLVELEKSLRTSNERTIMNRRYQAMRAKTEEGSYFSEEEMKHRDPYLYHQMVGQYLNEEERRLPDIDRSDHRFSTVLMEFMNKCDDDRLYNEAKEKEEEVEEETDSEDEEGSETEMAATVEGASTSSGTAGAEGPAATPATPAISEEERQLLRTEFLHMMQERFMAGQDRDFDYRTVDENADYDPLDIRGCDEEEKYFDEMEPESASDNLDSDSDCWTKPGPT